MIPLQICPDWQRSYESVQAITQHLTGFKWKGVGWYTKDDKTLLIVKNKANGQWPSFPWKGPSVRLAQGDMLTMYVWERPFSSLLFAHLGSIRHAIDDRTL
jgi:hypothetical protein